ncbi:MAG: hypothetical protein CR982_00130 [Candidatus Cloacimonadota bacterium]|nr:MAG: hypothetical protein CR982_00130 [Candidatus Cloacimonadota bacterium]PIE79113.1 MAG: hypothetical protein CSA15_04375 [Candidatus Delongbacteria bacterium]
MSVKNENINFVEESYLFISEFFSKISIPIDKEKINDLLSLICSKKVLDFSDVNKWSGAVSHLIIKESGFGVSNSVVADFFVMTMEDLSEFGNMLKSVVGSERSQFKVTNRKSSSSIILPVAGGKGGIGKSLISTSLAISFANRGYRTVVVDLDLGGSNLHSYLNMPNKFLGIGDYLSSNNLGFSEVVKETDIENLSFIPGDGRTPFMANISYQKRMRLIREIKALDYDYIILDVGAGSSFNTLSYFNLSPRGIMVTGTENSSIMNFLTFLKNLFFKIILAASKSRPQIVSVLEDMLKNSTASNPVYVSTLLNKLSHLDKALYYKMRQHLSKYRPRIVFNMIDDPSELKILTNLDRILKQNLSLECDFIGGIKFDDQVRRSIKSKQSIVMKGGGEFQKSIESIASKIEDNSLIGSSYLSLISEMRIK